MRLKKSAADQLRAAIRLSGRTQKELGRAAKVPQPILSRFLAYGSTKTVTLDTAEALVHALRITLILR